MIQIKKIIDLQMSKDLFMQKSDLEKNKFENLLIITCIRCNLD